MIKFFRLFLLTGLMVVGGMMQSFAQNSWTKLSNFGGDGRHSAVSFTINGKGYIGTGMHLPEDHRGDFWEYDPATDVWTQVADLPFRKSFAVGFAILGKGYVVTGRDDSASTLYQLDPVLNTWTKKADFPGNQRTGAVAFVIGHKAYVGLGAGSGIWNQDFWSYDPILDEWNRISDFPGTGRNSTAAFSIGSEGFVGCGIDSNLSPLKDFWSYNAFTDVWTQKSDFGGQARLQHVGFSIGRRGYLGMGNYGGSGPKAKDFWEYNPDTDTWQQMLDLPDNPLTQSTALVIDSNAYVGTGFQNPGSGETDVFWGFRPDSIYDITIGIPESKSINSFHAVVTPNPTNGELRLLFKQTVGELVINITDLKGKLIESQAHSVNAQVLSINLDYPNGIYFLKLMDPSTGHFQNLKVVKN